MRVNVDVDKMYEIQPKSKINVTIFRKSENSYTPLHSFVMEMEREVDMIIKAGEWIFKNIESDDIENMAFSFDKIEKDILEN